MQSLLLSLSTVWTVGIEGLPLSYLLQRDNGVTVVLLCCFLFSAFVLSRSRKFLLQLAKDFLLHRERTSIFTTSTSTDMRYLLLLILQTCILFGVCIYSVSIVLQPALLKHFSPVSLLGIYVAGTLLYLFLKWFSYSFLGWIFFDSSRTSLWMESYSTLLYYLGFALFPFVLAIVYFNLNLQATLVVGLLLVTFTKILMFYKWIKLFCNNLYGCFLLILYFCALEIVPGFLLYRGMMDINDYWTIKI
ncbi:MAG: DUF4271 domain-containing protein [Bacteroides sp.]|nr:DUF4271 domain-containing protein [Bacteroides sp.]